LVFINDRTGLGDTNISVLNGDGQGGFMTTVDFPAGPVVMAVAPGDLNGDGKVDLAVASRDAGVSVLTNQTE
jgi:hypothetical protein